MSRIELGGIAIKTVGDIARLKNQHENNAAPLQAEREFARLLLEKTSLDVTYEPTMFNFMGEDGIERGTLPDFRVVNLQTGVTTYIEITTSPNGKNRQKMVMQGAAPDIHYVVFHRDKLEAIEQKFPDYHFFNGQTPAK
jgi:hypothetical protein